MLPQQKLVHRKRGRDVIEDEVLPEWQPATTRVIQEKPLLLKYDHQIKRSMQTLIEKNHKHNQEVWILRIPIETFYHILEFIAPSAFPSLHLVCQHLHQVMSSSWIWKHLWKAQGWEERDNGFGLDHYSKWRNRFLMKGITESNWMNGKFLSRDLSLKFPQRTLFPSTICHLSDDYIVCGHHTIDSDYHMLVINHNKEIVSSAQVAYESSSTVCTPEHSKEVWYSIPNQNQKCLLWNMLSKDLYSVNIGEKTQHLAFDIGKICYTTANTMAVVDIAAERTRGIAAVSGISKIALDSLQPNRLAAKQDSMVHLWDLKNFSVTHKIGGKAPIKNFQARDNLIAVSYNSMSDVELFDIRYSGSKPLHIFSKAGMHIDHFQFDDTKLVATWGNDLGVFHLKTGQLASQITDVGCTLQQMQFHKDKLLLVNFLHLKVCYFGNWHSLYFPEQQPLKKPKPKIKFNLSFTV